MKHMTLENLAGACGGRLVFSGELPGTEYSRALRIPDRRGENSLFIAVKGERVDGHCFIPDVFEKGALGVVCERLPENPAGPCILVEDSLKALRQIAAFYREQLPVKVVGITGSVGKTSTKEFIAAVLSRKYRVHKTQGNFNNEIGVPLTVLSMPEDTEVAVLEMGINHFGEMHRLSRIAQPDICVMTNIGQCHLEFLGSREGILKAKSEIFDFMQENGPRRAERGRRHACVGWAGEGKKACDLWNLLRPAGSRSGRKLRRVRRGYPDEGAFGKRSCVLPCGKGISGPHPASGESIWCIMRWRRRRQASCWGFRRRRSQPASRMSGASAAEAAFCRREAVL